MTVWLVALLLASDRPAMLFWMMLLRTSDPAVPAPSTMPKPRLLPLVLGPVAPAESPGGAVASRRGQLSLPTLGPRAGARRSSSGCSRKGRRLGRQAFRREDEDHSRANQLFITHPGEAREMCGDVG